MRSSWKPNRLHSYPHACRPAVKNRWLTRGHSVIPPPPPDPWDFAQFLPHGFFGNFTELSQARKSEVLTLPGSFINSAVFLVILAIPTTTRIRYDTYHKPLLSTGGNKRYSSCR